MDRFSIAFLWLALSVLPVFARRLLDLVKCAAGLSAYYARRVCAAPCTARCRCWNMRGERSSTRESR